MMIAMPASSRNCLARSLPNRVPFPAAAMIATFIRGVASHGRCRQEEFSPKLFRHRLAVGRDSQRRGGISYLTLITSSAIGAVFAGTIIRIFPKAPKDHLSGCGLQDTGHGDVGIAANQSAGVVDHHHRAVIKVSHPLVVLLTLF